MPTYEQLYQFIKKHYKHSRFEGMAGDWCPEYAELITKSYMETLKEKGVAIISCHESYSGQMKTFNADLDFIQDDRPPEERAEYNHGKGNLTHLLS